MTPVFQAKVKDPEIDRRATLGSQLMSSVVSFHELGHFYLGRNPRSWDQMLGPLAETVWPLFERVNSTYNTAFVEEFMCDVLSIASCLGQYGETVGREFCLRATAFAFATFAVLSSLTKSAYQTAEEQSGNVDDVDFASIEKRDRNYTFAIGIDLDFVERARLAIELCGLLAEREGLPFAELEGPFPLPPTILDDLLSYVKDIMESDDRNAREMSLLVAEALHEHPRGLEYLKMRSKTFSFGSQRNPDGSLKALN